LNKAIQLEDKVSRSRSKHEGESSADICDRPGRIRVRSLRQLPTDHDYAVPTREYQLDQSSPIPASAAADPVLDRKRRPAHLDRSLHINVRIADNTDRTIKRIESFRVARVLASSVWETNRFTNGFYASVVSGYGTRAPTARFDRSRCFSVLPSVTSSRCCSCSHRARLRFVRLPLTILPADRTRVRENAARRMHRPMGDESRGRSAVPTSRNVHPWRRCNRASYHRATSWPSLQALLPRS
jgi:hypothetical protein